MWSTSRSQQYKLTASAEDGINIELEALERTQVERWRKKRSRKQKTSKENRTPSRFPLKRQRPREKPISTLSRFWGFPVYFDVNEDGEYRRAERENARVIAEQRGMLLEEKRQRAVEAELLRRRRVEDESLFMMYVSKYGPLPGELFCSSNGLPGLAYRGLLVEASNKIKRWWVSIWPQRALRKHEAASFLQRLTRGANGRRRYRHEKSRYATVQKMIKRARNRHMCQAWNTFVQNARQLIQFRQLFSRALKSITRYAFDGFRQHVVRLRLARQQKMRNFLRKMRSAKVLKLFNTWLDFVISIRKVKAMAQRALSGTLEHCFATWTSFVNNALDIRIAESTLVIQRFARNHVLSEQKRRMAWAAMKEVRRRRRLKKRREIEKMQETERQRMEQEIMQVDKAKSDARKNVAESFATIFGYFELRGHASKIQAEAARRYESIAFDTAMSMARDTHVRAAEEKASRKARLLFRMDNPPPFACETCTDTFVTPKGKSTHVCPSAEKAKKLFSPKKGMAQLLNIPGFSEYDEFIENAKAESSPVSAADRMKKLRQFKILRAVVRDEELPVSNEGEGRSVGDNTTSGSGGYGDFVKRITTDTVTSDEDLAAEKFDVLVEAEVLGLDVDVEKERNGEKDVKMDPMEKLLSDLQNEGSEVEYLVSATAEGERRVSGAACRMSVAKLTVMGSEGSGKQGYPMHVLQASVLDMTYYKRYTMYAKWIEAILVAQRCIESMVAAGKHEPGLLMSEVVAGDSGDVFLRGDDASSKVVEDASTSLATEEEKEESEMETTRGILLTLMQCFKFQSLASDRRKKNLVLDVPEFRARSKKQRSRNPAWERRQTVLKEISKPTMKVPSTRRVSSKGLTLQERIKMQAGTFLLPGEVVGVAQEFEEKDINGFVCLGWIAKSVAPPLGGGADEGTAGTEAETERKRQEGCVDSEEERRHAFALAKVEEDRGRTFYARVPWDAASALAREAGGNASEPSSDSWSSENLGQGGSMFPHLLDILVLERESGDIRRLNLVFSKEKAEEKRRRRESADRPKRKKTSSRGKRKSAAGRVLTEQAVSERRGRQARQGPHLTRGLLTIDELAQQLINAVLAAAVQRVLGS